MAKSLDFLVVGAAKAGTTSLFHYLSQHPELAMPPGKEEPLFSRDREYGQGVDYYLHQHFGSTDPDCKWGTITPEYLMGGSYGQDQVGTPHKMLPTHDEWTVPSRIARHSSELKCAVLLRDPVERAFSHYRMAVLHGWETRSFTAAIEEELREPNLEAARREVSELNYVCLGEYGRLLAPYVEIFGSERLLILFTSRLARDPAATVRRTCEFLEVDPSFSPSNLGERYRPGATARRVSWLDLYALRNWLARAPGPRRAWFALSPAGRAKVNAYYTRGALAVRLWNRRADEAAPAPPDAALLRAHYADDEERLRELIGGGLAWDTSARRV